LARPQRAAPSVQLARTSGFPGAWSASEQMRAERSQRRSRSARASGQSGVPRARVSSNWRAVSASSLRAAARSIVPTSPRSELGSSADPRPSPPFAGPADDGPEAGSGILGGAAAGAGSRRAHDEKTKADTSSSSAEDFMSRASYPIRWPDGRVRSCAHFRRDRERDTATPTAGPEDQERRKDRGRDRSERHDGKSRDADEDRLGLPHRVPQA
jgi:hypothetical protein